MFSSTKRRATAISGLVLSIAAVLALTVASTGAYFTDSHPGQISGINGNVAVNVNGGVGAGQLNFDFSGILPGDTKTATMNVGNPTGNTEDVWLVFSNSNGMWSAVNDLGQYGKFTVGGYTYDNLNNKNTNAQPATPGQAGTPITGSYMSGSCSTVQRVPINYLPHAVKIASLASGATTTFDVTFQYNPCMTDHQSEAIFNPGTADSPIVASGPLQFAIVGFQGGVDPTSPFNGVNAITPLTLAAFAPFDHQQIQP